MSGPSPVERAALIEAHAAILREDAAALLREMLPDVTVVVEGESLRISGPGLRRRWRALRTAHLLRSVFG